MMASIIQGSDIGPASCVVTASDLHPVTSGNSMDKYADDTQLVVPAANVATYSGESANIEDWALANNLQQNRSKSVEIVVASPRSRRFVKIPLPAVPVFTRVQLIKIVGSDDEQEILHCAARRCVTGGMCICCLRQHGMTFRRRQQMTYAASAWWGLARAADRGRLEAFLRRTVTFGYRDASAPSPACICVQADDKLFNKILCTSALINNNFLIRILYKDLSCSRAKHCDFQLPYIDFIQFVSLVTLLLVHCIISPNFVIVVCL
jgi:hypothetical protein